MGRLQTPVTSRQTHNAAALTIASTASAVMSPVVRTIRVIGRTQAKRPAFQTAAAYCVWSRGSSAKNHASPDSAMSALSTAPYLRFTSAAIASSRGRLSRIRTSWRA